VKDSEKSQTKTALREIAKIHTGDFRLTGNQNIIIGNVDEAAKPEIIKLLKRYNAYNEGKVSPLRSNSLACVALYTCGLAFAEAELYLPTLIDKIETQLKSFNLEKQEITIRMTGCPNGCARPYNSEIGLVGRAPGTYNLYLGGSHCGNRLNTLYKEMLKEDQILEEMAELFGIYSKHRMENEHFGDFVIRKKIVAPEVFINSI
jgi:sulfite reductase (NADPH) hemoprotein beta-component